MALLSPFFNFYKFYIFFIFSHRNAKIFKTEENYLFFVKKEPFFNFLKKLKKCLKIGIISL